MQQTALICVYIGMKEANWIKIDSDNIHLLEPDYRVKYHNGYEWTEGKLDKFWIGRGFIATGVGNETCSFLNPMFGKSTFYTNV